MMLAGFPRLSADPAVCGGRPVVMGTRVRVSDVLDMLDMLDMLAGGASESEIADDFPYLKAADIRACLAYAAHGADHAIVLAAE